MGKLDIFEMKLEANGPFLSGSLINGDVLLRLKKDIDIARVVVYLYGGGQVEFVDGSGGNAASSSRPTYEDHETYVRLAQIVYSKNSSHLSGPLRRICRNELYKFKFEFRLPADLPSSFMTVIFYKLTAFLDCGGKSHETTVPIVVINDLDLNRYSGRVQLAEPIDLWSLARSRSDTGLISARLVANKRGYAIGEALAMQVEIYNNSRTKLENINACLVQKGVLKAYGAGGLQLRRVQRLLVKNLCLGRLRGAERLLVDDAKLALPWLVTNEVERSSRLIEIEYYLQLTSSTPVISAVTGAPLSQIVCVGPDYRKAEVVSVLAEEQIVIGMRALREPATAMETDQQQQQQHQQSQQSQQSQQHPQHHQQQLYPSVNGVSSGGGASVVPTAPPPPPPDGSDLTMFTMIPSAPPSYDEAIGGGGGPGGHPEKVPLSSPTDSGDSPEREAN